MSSFLSRCSELVHRNGAGWARQALQAMCTLPSRQQWGPVHDHGVAYLRSAYPDTSRTQLPLWAPARCQLLWGLPGSVLSPWQCQQRSVHHLRRPKHLQAKRKWAVDSEIRDSVIRTLPDLDQAESYWRANGGSIHSVPGEHSATGPMRASSPCRLTHYNLATFLVRLAQLAPQGILGNPATGGVETQWARRDINRLRRLCSAACGKLQRRGKLADPSTVGRALSAVSQLGHSRPTLTRDLLSVATQRMSEATSRDLSAIGQALQHLQYKDGAEWWSKAWQHLEQLLPSGLLPTGHVIRFMEAGQALGHPAPEAVAQYMQAVERAALPAGRAVVSASVAS